MLPPTLDAARSALPPEGAPCGLGRPGAAAMHAYLVTISMPDGSQGEHHGLYAHGIDAVIAAIERFPTARRFSARWVAA